MLNKLFNKLKNKGEMKMKTESNLLEISGVKTPDFTEPKGAAYYKLLAQKTDKINKQKSIRSQANSEIIAIEKEIKQIDRTLLEDINQSEVYELKRKRSELKKKIPPLEAAAYMDIQKDIDDLMNDPQLAKLREEALQEHKANREIISQYDKALEKSYRESKKKINGFMAGYRSDSKFRMASILKNRLSN
ncbi:hypothetical protein [Marinilactibacillus psychrotolerans]|uniref:hypothetical protein n=1 Tax=Marinilactibacillus psychrotolerans TaxID=191770 RepID=UPI003885A539